MAGGVLQRPRKKGEGDEPRKVQDIEKYCSPLTTMWMCPLMCVGRGCWPGFKMNDICGEGGHATHMCEPAAVPLLKWEERLRHAKMGRWEYHDSGIWKVGLKGP